VRAIAAFLVLLASACGSAHSRATELLPDLVQLPPRALTVYRVDGRWGLGFLSAVDNDGAGPIVLEGRRANRSVPTMAVTQVVRRSDGSAAAYRVDGSIRFVQSETHRHWHYLDFERYEILTPAGEMMGRDHKTGFCLGDRYDAQMSVRRPQEPVEPIWTQECGRDEPQRLVVREGISPGYGDDYVPRLEGQWIDITRLPDGRYLLRHRVNAERALRESNYENDSASVPLLLRWRAGTPHVRALYDG
jgi:hypothetical protein